MKSIVFSQHALNQMPDRGASREEVEITIRDGERTAVKEGRSAFRKNFPFQREWKGHYYKVKQVMPIVAEKNDTMIVITVYVFYFGGDR